MKLLISILLLVAVTLTFASCHNNEDPFAESTDAIDSSLISTNDTSESIDTSGIIDSSKPTGDTTSRQGQPGPEDGFYSLSASAAYQKYGLFAPDINVLKACDGEHIFTTGTEQVLNRADYPSGNNKRPVCTDPLCTHKPGSLCPLANLSSMFGMACYGDKLLYIGKDGELYAYTPETNRSISILKGCSKASFHRYCGNFYLINPEEDGNFNSINRIYQITKNAEVINIGSVEEQFSNGFFVRSESTVVGFDIKTLDGTSPATVSIYNIEDKTRKTVFERTFPELSGDERDEAGIVPMSIFGDKVLFSVRCSSQKSGETVELSEIWLVDVITGEKRLLTMIHSLHTNYYCQFSEKYICTVDWRNEETDPYLIRFLDPYGGEESVYNLSEMAAEIGETIPLTDRSIDCHLSTVNQFAPLLSKTYQIPYTGVNDEGKEFTSYRLKQFKYMVFDLESGRVYKYPEPTEEDLAIDGT